MAGGRGAGACGVRLSTRFGGMQSPGVKTLQRATVLLAGLLVVKVTASVVLGYRDYFPPNFAADFLRGRESYFFGAYRWAFYAHLAAGPVTLVLGLLLVSNGFRQRWPRWHRNVGKTQILLILMLLVPSGLWMARYAQLGVVSGAGFATLALATGACAWLGWRTAVKRRFAEHRVWMVRCFLLLCSAVVLRVIGGLATVTGVGSTWSYPLAAWASWLVPLAAFECYRRGGRRIAAAATSAAGHSRLSSESAMSSFPAMETSARR